MTVKANSSEALFVVFEYALLAVDDFLSIDNGSAGSDGVTHTLCVFFLPLKSFRLYGNAWESNSGMVFPTAKRLGDSLRLSFTVKSPAQAIGFRAWVLVHTGLFV